MDKNIFTTCTKFPTIDSAASEIVNLSAIRSMPKGTEYFSAISTGSMKPFAYAKSASGMIKTR